MKIGGSISYQLVDIFNIIESDLPEQEKREKVSEYQKGLTSRDKETSIIMGDEGENGSNIKNGCFVFGDVDVMSYEELCATKDYVEKNLSSLTCEAEMKMSAIVRGYDKETHLVQYNFDLADKVYKYAESKGKEMRGHTLVWHNHEPQALEDYIEDRLGCSMEEYEFEHPEDFAEKRRQYTLDFLKDYMKTMGEQYPECYCWDVINEIVPDMHTDKPTEHERENGLRDSKWNEYIGQDEEGNDWYIEVLKIARESLPEGTKLVYNEYGEQHPEKREAILRVIENIKKYEQSHDCSLLDSVGLQSHYDANTPIEQIEETYKQISKALEGTGKDFYVTEADVSPGRDEYGKEIPFDLTNQEQQKNKEKIWQKMFDLSETYNSEYFTGWGISDSLNWCGRVEGTMIDKDGAVKDFAKDFIERQKECYHFTYLNRAFSIGESGLDLRLEGNSKAISDSKLKISYSKGKIGAIGLFANFYTVYEDYKTGRRKPERPGEIEQYKAIMESENFEDFLGEGIYLKFDGTDVKNTGGNSGKGGIFDASTVDPIPSENLEVCLIKNMATDEISYSKYDYIHYLMSTLTQEEKEQMPSDNQEFFEFYYKEHLEEIEKFKNGDFSIETIGLEEFCQKYKKEIEADIKKYRTKSTQELGKEVVPEMEDVALEDETEQTQEKQENQLEDKTLIGQNL